MRLAESIQKEGYIFPTPYKFSNQTFKVMRLAESIQKGGYIHFKTSDGSSQFIPLLARTLTRPYLRLNICLFIENTLLKMGNSSSLPEDDKDHDNGNDNHPDHKDNHDYNNDNHSNQLNPNNFEYWHSRGTTKSWTV